MVKHEEFKVSGKNLKKKVKNLIQEGNVRKIIIKNSDGNELVVIPVNFAVVGAVIAPMLAAVGAIAALLTNCTLVVERKDN